MKRQGLLRQKQVSGSRSGRFRKHVQRREQFNQDNHVRRVNRRGVLVFINNVSKRIQPSTLREAFQEYGNITDVYIAYYNPRRIRFESTFAFKSSVASKGCTVESKQYVKNNPVRVDLTRGKDERSYKEALLSEKKECQEEMVGKNQTDRKMKQCAEELTGKNRIEQSNIRNQTMGADCRVRRRLL
ncbi:hypothetical protein V6N11_040017 [Hibiscus sabdariffa]|uniref:RRM domain-containing protein n=1 Tax=Hibiscus sabdariffa TaxID=183260 RepID=A0ABR2RGM0_9ROSI